MNETSIELFYSYSHEDEALQCELLNHLSTLKRQGIIKEWHFRKISGGEEWKGKIDDHLSAAAIILLLISSNFIASDYCYDVEMRRAMERHEARKARVVPIILRPVDWQNTPFQKLQALPTDGKPVTTWPNTDEAFLDIAKGIRKICKDLQDPSITARTPSKIEGKSLPKDTLALSSHGLQEALSKNTIGCRFCNATGKIVDMLGDGRPCPICKGAGKVCFDSPSESLVECAYCNGTGKIEDIYGDRKLCPTCKGIGFTKPTPPESSAQPHATSRPSNPDTSSLSHDVEDNRRIEVGKDTLAMGNVSGNVDAGSLITGSIDNSKQNWLLIEREFGITKMAFGRKINFVSDKFTRSIIFRDVEQSFLLASSGFSKPAVILAGGVIEELLRLYLEDNHIPPISQNFDGYIKTCEQKGLLKSGISRLSDSVRHLRNLVHLSKETSKTYSISKATAKGAVSSIFTIANDF